jgi:hypothetical protein
MLYLKRKPNQRLTKAERQQKARVQEKPDVRRHPVRLKQQRHLTLKHWLGILLLTPVALITALTMAEMSYRLLGRHQLLAAESFRFFILGVFLWLGLYLGLQVRPTKLYVIGHELSHALVAKLTGAKIYRFEFTETGGFVETSKSNTWISLAPYILPFYSIVIFLFFGVLALITDLDSGFMVKLGSSQIHFKMTRYLFVLLGLSWAFHITYTLITLRTQQSDLTRNGEYFSLMLIFLINAAQILLLFTLHSPHPELGLAQTLQCWWGNAQRLLWF